MSWINGKKTYLGMIALGVWELLGQTGVFEPATLTLGRTIIVSLTGVSMRHAIDKATKK